MNDYKKSLTIEEIQEILPHRYPFLLVDRVVDMEKGKRIVAIKNVTINEPFFQGHFPGNPIMPGVLIIEALAQTAGILLLKFREKTSKVPVFMTIEEARFRLPVKPGNILRLEVELLRDGATFSKAKGIAFIEDGSVAAESVFMAGLIEREKV